MAIEDQQTILIGLPNESLGSDSLFTAFTKINTNFSILFSCASPYNNFIAGNGISISSNANAGNITITNTGITSLVAGTNIILNQSNGVVTISTTSGNGGGGTVTSVGLIAGSANRLTVTGSPITSNGNMIVDLAVSGANQGTYNNPTITIDSYGRVTNIANGNLQGTVTSIGLSPGSGIGITGGPITSNGIITVTNTGVTRLNAGVGITLNSSNGNVTISAPTTGGTVTSIGISSNTLAITNSPVATNGVINIELPSFIPGTLTTAAQQNITSVGTLISLAVTGNATVGNLIGNIANGNSNITIISNGNINISSVGNANIVTVTGTGVNVTGTLNTTGNANLGNLGVSSIVGNNLSLTSNANISGSLQLNSSEDLANGSAANLSVFASYFTTVAAETATLADGTIGQFKSFMMVEDGGDMVITVANAGWKTSGAGTITFSSLGDSCLLQYVSGKWFCVGNNNVAFA